MKDREKLMAVPSRSVASTFVGSCACSLGSAVRKYESRPGRTLWTARRSSSSAGDSCCPHSTQDMFAVPQRLVQQVQAFVGRVIE